MLKKIQALVQSQSHCVLATCGAAEDGRMAPHASLMSCCAAPGSGEFWLATLTGTQKHRNLLAVPRASLLFDDRAATPGQGGCGQPGQALTVSVQLTPFASACDEEAARQALLARHPHLEGFLAQEGVVLLRLVAGRFQLLDGLTQVFTVEAEKMLDAGGWKA